MSADLTEAAFDRNIEVGVLSRESALAASLERHSSRLDRSETPAAAAVGVGLRHEVGPTSCGDPFLRSTGPVPL
jgi:hypothetical protein